MVDLHKEEVQFAQSTQFFNLALQKCARISRLRGRFSGVRLRRLFIGRHLWMLGFQDPRFSVECFEPDFFDVSSAVLVRERKHLLDGAVVIISANDVAQSIREGRGGSFYSVYENTIFVLWDWDNHHWIDNSCVSAVLSDVYAPAHQENFYLLSRFNQSIVGPVHCASVQWTREFLIDNVSKIIESNRSCEPLGMHVPYALFSYRNSVVATLAAVYQKVNFTQGKFHHKDAMERLLEWCAYKLHWIVPVLNDVPIRIFDALITGGIPIVPESLRGVSPMRSLDDRFVEYFSAGDVLSPQSVVVRALAKFDSGGKDGVIERHRFALRFHHGHARITDLVSEVERLFGVRLDGD